MPSVTLPLVRTTSGRRSSWNAGRTIRAPLVFFGSLACSRGDLAGKLIAGLSVKEAVDTAKCAHWFSLC